MGESITLDASTLPASGAPLTLHPVWKVVAVPRGSTPTLSNVHSLTPTFRATKPGIYRVASPDGRKLQVTVQAWHSDLGVPIQTITKDHAIQVGSTSYPQQGNWIHLLVLDPATGAPMSDPSWGSGDQGFDVQRCEIIVKPCPAPAKFPLNKALAAVASHSQNALVIMTGQGLDVRTIPYLRGKNVAALDLAWKTLGGSFNPAAPITDVDTSPIKDAYQLLDGQWSIIGTPGLTQGLAKQNDRIGEAPIPGLAGGDPGLHGSLNGYLEPYGVGASATLVYASPEMLPLDTRAPGSTPTQNLITVGSNTYAAQHTATYPSANILPGAFAAQLLVLGADTDRRDAGFGLVGLANKTFYLSDPDGLTVQGGGPSHSPPPPPPPKDVGNVDVAAYCSHAHPGSQAALPGGRYGPGAVYRWKCQQGSTSYDVSFEDACKQQHDPNAFAKFTDQNDAYSWRCYVAVESGFSTLRAPGVYDLAYELHFWTTTTNIPKGEEPLVILQTFGGPLRPGGGPMASSYWVNDAPPRSTWANDPDEESGKDSPYPFDRNHLDLKDILSHWEWASPTVAGEIGALAGPAAHDMAADFGYAFPPLSLSAKDHVPSQEWPAQRTLGGITVVATTHTFSLDNAFSEGPVDPAAVAKLGPRYAVDCSTDLADKPLCTGGRVVGQLVRNDQSQLRLSTPSSTKQVIQGQPEDDFDTRTSRMIAFQPDVPWPCSAAHPAPCPGSPGQVESVDRYIARKLFNRDVDVRTMYADTKFDNPQYLTDLDQLDYPPVSQQPAGLPNFGPAVFNAMKSQLDTEFGDVFDVRLGVQKWQEVLGSGSVADSQVNVAKITDNVLQAVAQGRKEAIDAIKKREAEIDSTEALSSVLHIFSEVAEIAIASNPELEEFAFFLPAATGALSGVLELTHTMTPENEHPEDAVPDDSGAVRTTAVNLQQALQRQYENLSQTLLHLQDVYVTDWSRLQNASGKFDSLWSFPDQEIHDFAVAQTAAAAGEAYQALLPVAYKEYVVSPYRQDPNNNGVGALPRDYLCQPIGSDHLTKPFDDVPVGSMDVLHYRFDNDMVPAGTNQPARFDTGNARRLGLVIKENLPNVSVYDSVNDNAPSIRWGFGYPGGAPIPASIANTLFQPVNLADSLPGPLSGLGMDRNQFFDTGNWTTKRVSCGEIP